jgi:hypothetical protein
MFELYTEKARRTIFFGRYEASEFGSPYIETEHLLLGLMREDKALAHRFLRSHTAVDSIRKQIERHTVPGEKVPTSVDLPLSADCKRVLTYGAEEAERLKHKHIGTEHLLLGLLREEKCFAAQLLGEQGLTLDLVRKQLQQVEPTAAPSKSASFARIHQWLAEREERGGVRIITRNRGANKTPQFAIYASDPAQKNEKGEDASAIQKAAQIQDRIDLAIERMENAIAHHEFEKARFYSSEEHKERENLGLLREQFKLEEQPPQIPILCIEIAGDERFSEVRKRCEDCVAGGVTQIWLLDFDLKRAYIVTQDEGLCECRGRLLRIADPAIEMDLKTIFD